MKEWMRWVERIRDACSDLRFQQKLQIGYVLVVLIPVAALSLTLFYNNLQQLQKADRKQRSQNLDYYAEEVSSGLDLLASYSHFYQNQNALEQYLTGEYTTVSDCFFIWYSSLHDTCTCYAGDSRIRAITVYGRREYPLTFSGYLESLSAHPEWQDAFDEIQTIHYGRWKWDLTADGELVYCRPLYGSSYSLITGLLVIRANFDKFMEGFSQPFAEKTEVYLQKEETGEIFRMAEGGLEAVSASDVPSLQSGKNLLTSRIRSLNLSVIAVSPPYTVPPGQILLFVLTVLICLVLFSLVYTAVGRSLTRRLIDFTDFLSVQNAQDLKKYPGHIYRDEVGDVKRTYNELIDQINRLIHDNYEVSLKEKQASYYALLSQIRPHALYNVLENIRMSSIEHGDAETAHMTEAFGRYMRYLLNSGSSEATLEEELQAARNYLEVSQMRIGNELQYTFAVETELDRLPCPRFLFQTLLENCVSHAYVHGKPLHIRISVRGNDGSEMSETVLVSVADDGVGIREEQLAAMQEVLDSNIPSPGSRHVGLHNVNDRLKAINPDDSGMRIRSAPGQGTEIDFCLYRKSEKCGEPSQQ